MTADRKANSLCDLTQAWVSLKSIKKAMKREHKEFVSAVSRARKLYDRISKGKLWMGSSMRGPRAPDTRQVAQLLFFHVASQWEAFCTKAFELELKRLYSVRPDVASRIMSDVDGRGMVSGFGNPSLLKRRGKDLLGKNSPWARIEQDLGPLAYQNLVRGYRIRNFIAHAGLGKGKEDFAKLENDLGISKSERKGLSAGRLLLDYPRKRRKKLFEVLLDNYLDIANYVLKRAR